MNVKVHLASGSPRRQELLALTGWIVEPMPTDIDERELPGEGAASMTLRLARTKARAVADRDALVLGADTVVVDGGRMLGKPVDADDARKTLRQLRNRRHQVITSIVILEAERRIKLEDSCLSSVPMRDYDDGEIEAYLASESPLDKAGSYGIQDGGFDPVDLSAMRACFANVMGLPLCHVVRTMRKLGHEPPKNVPAACQQHTGYDCTVYPQILQGVESA